jgi:hypothetical protein
MLAGNFQAREQLKGELSLQEEEEFLSFLQDQILQEQDAEALNALRLKAPKLSKRVHSRRRYQNKKEGIETMHIQQHYLWNGEFVCKTFFLFVFCSSEIVTRSIHKHMAVHGTNFIPIEDHRGGNQILATPTYVLDVINFIRNFAAKHGHPNPSGAGIPYVNKISGHLEAAPIDGIIYLHSSYEKKSDFPSV